MPVVVVLLLALLCAAPIRMGCCSVHTRALILLCSHTKSARFIISAYSVSQMSSMACRCAPRPALSAARAVLPAGRNAPRNYRGLGSVRVHGLSDEEKQAQLQAAMQDPEVRGACMFPRMKNTCIE